MNDDFENRLQGLRPKNLPEAWSAEILGQARAAQSPSIRPPRWLMAGWGVAWAAVIVLHFTTPDESSSLMARTSTGIQPRLRQRTETLNALLALNSESLPPTP